MLGIGSIFTPRELRGRGAASALIAHVVDAANTEGHEFVLLFSDIGPTFYERLDFVPVPLEQATLTVHMKGGAPAMLVRAGDDRDLPHIAELGLTRAVGARLALDRTEDYIRHAVTRRRLLAGLGPPGARQIEFLVAEEGHMAVAYLVCTAHHGRWTIEEAGDRDPSGARIGAMLQVMLAREPSQPPPEIAAWWPQSLTPPQLEVVGATRHRRGDDDPPASRPHAADAAAGGVRRRVLARRSVLDVAVRVQRFVILNVQVPRQVPCTTVPAAAVIVIVKSPSLQARLSMETTAAPELFRYGTTLLDRQPRLSAQEPARVKLPAVG